VSKKKPLEAPAPAPPFHNPFGALGELRGSLPSRPSEQAPAGAPTKPEGPARAVVRMERKGRGGKEVTVVEQLGLPPKELERWLRELKNALGCGGAVEENTLVFQGDQRERVKGVLEKRGVRRISMG
jgi:translation initiation factor 1